MTLLDGDTERTLVKALSHGEHWINVKNHLDIGTVGGGHSVVFKSGSLDATLTGFVTY